MGNLKRAFLVNATDCCVANMTEHNGYREHFLESGYDLTADPASADIVLVSTCAVTKEMEDCSAKIISELQKNHPKKQILVVGCLPKVNPQRVPGELVAATLPLKSKMNLWPEKTPPIAPEDCTDRSLRHKIARLGSHALDLLAKYQILAPKKLKFILDSAVVNPDYYSLLAARGCLGNCTYCGIRKAKGLLQSRPLPQILKEFDSALASGERKFLLLGDDIGGWGTDLGSNFVELLKALLLRPNPFELVIHYLDPTFLLKHRMEIPTLFGDPRLISANIPVQSGSNRIIHKMGRNYRLQDLDSAMATIRRLNPDFVVKTNYIIGFPGETWIDFLKSIASLWQFDMIHATRYSLRPNTPAARYPDQVQEPIKFIRICIFYFSIVFRHGFVAMAAFFRKKGNHG